MNIVLIFGILLVLLKLFLRFAYVYGFILLFGSYIEIYTYTWSEAPFIFGLVIFSAAISILIIRQSTKTGGWILPLAGIFLASLALFFSRYIGAFSIGIIGILSLYFIFMKREFKIGFSLISVLMLNTIIVFLYLQKNMIETGYSTGMPRIAAPETHFELIYSLLKTFFCELVFPVAHLGSKKILFLILFVQLLVIFLAVYFAKLSVHNYLENRKIDAIVVIFFLVGIIYLLSIITIRWLTQFDGFSYRLIAPGTFLIFVAILRHLELSFNPKDFKLLSLGILTISFISIFCSAIYPVVRQIYLQKQNHFENAKKIMSDFEDIKSGSIIVFGDYKLKYLRPDILLPYYDQKEEFNYFLNRLNPNRQVYIQIPDKIDPCCYHISVIEFVSKYKPGEIVKIR